MHWSISSLRYKDIVVYNDCACYEENYHYIYWKQICYIYSHSLSCVCCNEYKFSCYIWCKVITPLLHTLVILIFVLICHTCNNCHLTTSLLEKKNIITLLSVLTVFANVIVWIVLIVHRISSSSNIFTRLFETLLSTQSLESLKCNCIRFVETLTVSWKAIFSCVRERYTFIT